MTEKHTAPLGELIEEYRAIEAPPGIAAAVHSQLDARHPGKAAWFMPAFGALATAAGLAGALFLVRESPELSNDPALKAMPRPTLSSLSRIKIEKPKSVSVSLSKLRYISIPAIPPTPKLKPVQKPDTEINLDANNIPQQENHHVYT